MEINIEDLVRGRIEDMDLRCMVKDIIESLISTDVRAEIKNVVQRECLRIVESEIVKYLNGEVKTDDGWGKQEKFVSLEDRFRKELAEKLKGSWEATRVIERHLKERVDSIMKTQMSEVVEKIVNELTGSYLKKP
jgi:ATP-dependent protease HslVU (ClpYQ) ATPase subunit